MEKHQKTTESGQARLGAVLFARCDTLNKQVCELIGMVSPCLQPERNSPCEETGQDKDPEEHSPVTAMLRDLEVALMGIEDNVKDAVHRIKWE